MENIIAELFPKTVKALRDDFLRIKGVAMENKEEAMSWVKDEVVPTAKKASSLLEGVGDLSLRSLAAPRRRTPWGKIAIGLGAVSVAAYVYSKRRTIQDKWSEAREKASAKMNEQDQNRSSSQDFSQSQDQSGDTSSVGMSSESSFSSTTPDFQSSENVTPQKSSSRSKKSLDLEQEGSGPKIH